MSELDMKKVFVGNVPFQCTDEEFNECFKDQDGFVESKIIKRVSSTLSRGFGYIEFNTSDQAKHFIENCGEVQLKDRTLRFNTYHHNKINTSNTSKDSDFNTDHKLSNYKVFVDDLDENTTKEDLQTAFNKYEDLVACFVNTSKNTNKKSGVIIFNSLESCKDALRNPPNYLKVKPFKKFIKSQTTDVRKIYREGYNAGYIVGFQKGLNKGLSQTQNNAPSACT